MRDQDLDGGVALVLGAVPFDQPRRGRVLPPVSAATLARSPRWRLSSVSAQDTVMDAVREHREPLVDDPDRVGVVAQLGVDETSWLRATKDHATLYATGLVDLTRRIVIDVIPGNSTKDLGFWLDRQPEDWLKQDPGGGDGPSRVLPRRAQRTPRSRDPGRRSLPRRAPGQPLPRSGPSSRSEPDPRPPR